MSYDSWKLASPVDRGKYQCGICADKMTEDDFAWQDGLCSDCACTHCHKREREPGCMECCECYDMLHPDDMR